MKKLLLATAAALLFAQSASAQPRYMPYGPYPYGAPPPRYAPVQPYMRYAPPPYQRGPTPLDIFGAFLGAIPMIAGSIPPQPQYAPPPQYQTPQTQTQYDPRDPNLYLEEYRVTKQEVEAAMQQYCSEHGETVVCQKIENMMRQQRRP